MMTNALTKPRRPLAVSIVSILIFVTAVGYLAAGIFSLAVELSGNRAALMAIFASQESSASLVGEGSLVALAVVFCVIGVTQLIIGIGFLALKRWAWVTLMTLQVIALLSELGSFYNGEEAAYTAPLAILLVLLLNQSDVRRAFGIIRSRNDSSTNSSLNRVNVN